MIYVAQPPIAITGDLEAFSFHLIIFGVLFIGTVILDLSVINYSEYNRRVFITRRYFFPLIMICVEFRIVLMWIVYGRYLHSECVFSSSTVHYII